MLTGNFGACRHFFESSTHNRGQDSNIITVKTSGGIRVAGEKDEFTELCIKKSIDFQTVAIAWNDKIAGMPSLHQLAFSCCFLTYPSM